MTPNLLESRFFGYEKGAFTGADKQMQGLFELADGGTLFLDEIGELPLEAQGVLLRELLNLLARAAVLEENDFGRLVAKHREMNAGLMGSDELAKDGIIPDELSEESDLAAELQ